MWKWSERANVKCGVFWWMAGNIFFFVECAVRESQGEITLMKFMNFIRGGS